MKFVIAFVFTFFSTDLISVEYQTALEDGRKVILRDDKTWDFVDTSTTSAPLITAKYAEEAVEVWDKSLTLQEVNYQDSVALFLHYKNNTNKKIIGLSVHVNILNPFGKSVSERTYDDETVLEPGQTLKNDTYWHYNDNPFISGEPYDLMWQIAKNGTAVIKTKIRKVIFADGTVLVNRPNSNIKKK